MIITMVSVGMVQMAINQVVNVIAMRHGFVPAGGSVDVAFWVAPDFVIATASVRMFRIHFDDMRGYRPTFLVLQVALGQIIGMAVVFDSGMAATRPVLMLFGIFHNNQFRV